MRKLIKSINRNHQFLQFLLDDWNTLLPCCTINGQSWRNWPLTVDHHYSWHHFFNVVNSFLYSYAFQCVCSCVVLWKHATTWDRVVDIQSQKSNRLGLCIVCVWRQVYKDQKPGVSWSLLVIVSHCLLLDWSVMRNWFNMLEQNSQASLEWIITRINRDSTVHKHWITCKCTNRRQLQLAQKEKHWIEIVWIASWGKNGVFSKTFIQLRVRFTRARMLHFGGAGRMKVLFGSR